MFSIYNPNPSTISNRSTHNDPIRVTVKITVSRVRVRAGVWVIRVRFRARIPIVTLKMWQVAGSR